ncbi:hypothetical protein ACWDUG_33505, partial [Streptomyces cellulosae]
MIFGPTADSRIGRVGRQDGVVTLIDQLPKTADPDALYEAFESWAQERGLTLYAHQEEALIEVVSGANVIVDGGVQVAVADAGPFGTAGLAAED